MKENIVGIDIGTSSIKAAVITADGKNLGKQFGKIGIIHRHPGWAEQDMNVVWETVTACIKGCLMKAGLSGADIGAVCCTGQGDGAWMIDVDGKPLGLATLWNDNRAASIVEKWVFDEVIARVYKRTATILWPGSLAGIVAWYQDNDRESLKKLYKVFCCKDWVNYRFTGCIATDTTDGTIPFTNIKTRLVDSAVLADLGLEFLEDKLAPVRNSASIVGEVTPEAAAASGLKPGTVVVTGCLDVTANAIGGGVVSPGHALLILGTTSLLAADFEEAPADDRNVGAALIHAVKGQWLRVFGAQSGTPNCDWMGQAFNILKIGDKGGIDFVEIDRLIAKAPAGSLGMLYHPFLFGERVPFLNPDATSGFFGISAGTGTGELCRSVYEGVAFSAKHCLEEMDTTFNKITMTGGGTYSDLWCRIIANVLNCEISIPEGEELGVLGAAIIGGIGIGIYQSYTEAVQKLVKERKCYIPEPKDAARYEELFPLYLELIEKMKTFWKKRAMLLKKWNTEV
jgi:sugar (pentulose or hexulose) kinase